MKKFFGVIGNPPYDETSDADSTRKNPVYNYFMDETFKTSERVELITPARFLFKGGYTPKAWDQKMLDDKHFAVLDYEPDSTKVFPGILLEGGLAITLHDESREIGPIGVYVKYKQLNEILCKVREKKLQPFKRHSFATTQLSAF